MKVGNYNKLSIIYISLKPTFNELTVVTVIIYFVNQSSYHVVKSSVPPKKYVWLTT